MSGDEFRAARLAAGLSYRNAARRLGVSPSTIYRWEQDGTPSDITFGASARNPTGYALGQLLAVAEHALGRRLPERLYQPTSVARMISDTATYILGKPAIQDLAGQISLRINAADLLEPWSPEIESAMWLGYYHQCAALRDLEDVPA